ncbi:DNA polymerase III subunit gamma/tau [Rhodocaloribacter sp.]
MSSQRYLVTARKYRPQLFREVVAQEHVTETLKNAIRLDRLAHAYLFSGPRGVGKTTAARILAKAINCTTPPEEREDATEPCRRCDSCRSFEEGRNLNIIEIDAASNNKVEDIRELRDTVRIPPQGNRKKVYIVDEVHMLSNAAFNALLKTLEEPPPYVLFIFATTEPHKVLPTILSRCQRFDFRRIAVPEIIAQLRHICAEEDITADDAALMLIARKGDGALRDALSVFDQAVSLCGTDLRHDDLASALGVVDIDLFFDITQNVAAHDGAGMIRQVERIVRAGYDLQEFVDGLAEHLRNLLVARTMPDTSLIEAVEATRRRYAEHSRAFTEPDLLRLLMIVSGAEEALRSSRQPRLHLEMTLLKMAALSHAADLREALTRLDRMERMVAKGERPARLFEAAAPPPATAPPPAAAPKPAETKAPAPAPPHPADSAREHAPPHPAETAREHAPPTPPHPAETAREHAPHPAEAKAPEAERPAAPEPPEPGVKEDDVPYAAPPPRPAPAPSLSDAPATGAPSPDLYPSLFGPPALKKKTPRNGGSAPSASADVAVVEAEAPVAVAAEPPPMLRRIEAAWPSFVQAVTGARIHVGALLQHTAPLDARDGAVRVAVPDAFHQRLLNNQHDFLLTHLRSAADEDVRRLQFVIRPDAPAAAPGEPDPEIDLMTYFRRKREENPVLRAIFEQFGGEISW